MWSPQGWLQPGGISAGLHSWVLWLLPSVSVRLQLKRSRETEVQLKPLVEKNKRMNKKNEDLLQSIQRMEEKIKNLTRENVEMVSHGSGALVSPGLLQPLTRAVQVGPGHLPPPRPQPHPIPPASIPENSQCCGHLCPKECVPGGLTAGLHLHSAISAWGPWAQTSFSSMKWDCKHQCCRVRDRME